jgi:hypothetical protein
VRYNDGNHIDCSGGAVFARRRGLGILSVARLTQAKYESSTLLDPVAFMRLQASEHGDRPWDFEVPGTGSPESSVPMHPNAILHESEQLHKISDRLDSLAEQHPHVSEALITISGSVRNTATLLEVLVATKMGPLSGLDQANA